MRSFSPLHIIGVGLVGTGVGFLSRDEEKSEVEKAKKPLMIHYLDYSTISTLWKYVPGFKEWFAKLLEMENVKIILNSTEVNVTETYGLEKSMQIEFIKNTIGKELGYNEKEILEKIDFIYTETSKVVLEGREGKFTKADYLEAWITRNRREGNIVDEKELVIVSYDDLGIHLTNLAVHKFQPESKVNKSITLGLLGPAKMGFYGYDKTPDMQMLKQRDPDLFDNADIDNENFIVPEFFREQVNEKMAALEPEWEDLLAKADPMNRELIKYGIREDDRSQIIKEYKNIEELKKRIKIVIEAIEIEEKNTNIPDFQIPEPSRVSIIKAYLMREILDEEELEEGEYDFELGEQILKRPFIDNSIDEYKLEKWVKAHKGIYRKVARFMADHITYFNQEKTEDMLGQSLKEFNKEVKDKECLVIKSGLGGRSINWMHDIGTYKKDGLDWGYHTYDLAEHNKSGFMAGAVERGAGIVITDDAAYSGEQIEFTINNIVGNLKIGKLKRKDITIHLVIPFMTKQAENRLKKYIIDISEKEGMQITLKTYIQQHIETVPDIFQREIAQNPNKKKELEKLLEAFYEMFPFRPRDGYDETLTYFHHKIADYQSVVGINTPIGQKTVLEDGVVVEGGKKADEIPFILETMPPYYNITWVEGTNEGRTAAVKSMLRSRRYAKLLGIKSIETGKNTKFRDGILILNEEMHRKVVDVMSWSTDPDRAKNLLRAIVAFEKHKKKKGKKLYSLIAEELKPYMSEIEITALPLWFNKIVPGQVNLKDIEIEEYIRAEMGNWLYNKYPEKADQLIDEVLKINSQINAEKRNIQENMERGMIDPDEEEEEEEVKEIKKPGIGKFMTVLFGRFARATVALPVEAFIRINPISTTRKWDGLMAAALGEEGSIYSIIYMLEKLQGLFRKKDKNLIPKLNNVMYFFMAT